MDKERIIGRKVRWAVFGWLGLETVLGKVIDTADKEGFYRVEGYTLFGVRHQDIKSISELEFE